MARRKPLYRPEFADEAYRLRLLRLDEREIADFFGVSPSTLKSWGIKFPEFGKAIREGGLSADAQVAQAMHKRATGFYAQEIHISTYEGQVIATPVDKYYAPDPAAGRYWLNNRTGGKWKDKMEITGDEARPPKAMVLVVTEGDIDVPEGGEDDEDG